jgi:hypothetical protein
LAAVTAGALGWTGDVDPQAVAPKTMTTIPARWIR